MIEKLRLKCENLMTFIPSNLYIHSKENHETVRFSRLTIPDFLTHYVEDSINRLIDEKEEINYDELTENQVYMYIDPFKMCYLTWPLTTDAGDHHTITLGPIITEHLTAEEIRYIGYKMKLSSDSCFILESFYGIVPFFDSMQLARIASVFLDYLAVEPHLPQIVREDHSTIMPEEAKAIENKFETFDFVEKNYAAEAEFLHAIEVGDIEFIKRLNGTLNSAITVPPRYPSDPLRERKNLAITLNSISLRAAVKGGLNPSLAHSLSHNFAIMIEQQTTVEALLKMNQRIFMTYTESVRKYAMKGYSETIIEAVTYIRVHLTDKVSLAEIADHLHLSGEHLSRQFKKEMKMTLTDFLHKTKVEESCNLLTGRLYSISDIAYTFSYSSPAHYTKMFKKFMGMSPKQWQKEKHPEVFE